MRAARVTVDGSCGTLLRRPTLRERAPEIILDDLAELIENAGAAEASAVALGIPTILDPAGRLLPSKNLPTLGGCDLCGELSGRLQQPVRAFNDAACFTMGEFWHGLGRKTQCFCGVTLGTGIGLGLIIAGRLHIGSHGSAGEIWQAPWRGGTLEDFVSGPALETAYCRHAGEAVGGAEICARLERGEPAARAAIAELGEDLGAALAWLVGIVDPEAIAFGGSMALTFPCFEQSLRDTLVQHTVSTARPLLAPGELGERASLLGAVKLWHDSQ